LEIKQPNASRGLNRGERRLHLKKRIATGGELGEALGTFILKKDGENPQKKIPCNGTTWGSEGTQALQITTQEGQNSPKTVYTKNDEMPRK